MAEATLTFEVNDVEYVADLHISEKPSAKFLRLTKRMQAMAEKGDKLTDAEGVDSIILASDYLAAFGLDVDDLPADELFQVLAGLFKAMQEAQELDPTERSGSEKPSRSTARKSRTNS